MRWGATNLRYRRIDAETSREQVVSIAEELLGAPSVEYTAGHPELGQSPERGFDCSGFVGYVLRRAGIFVPPFVGMDGRIRDIRHTNEYLDHFGISVHAEMRQPGDLVFFSKNGAHPAHMGILNSRDSYVHAPGVSDPARSEVTVDDLKPGDTVEYDPSSGYPQLYTENPIAFKSITVPVPSPSHRYHQQTLRR